METGALPMRSAWAEHGLITRDAAAGYAGSDVEQAEHEQRHDQPSPGWSRRCGGRHRSAWGDGSRTSAVLPTPWHGGRAAALAAKPPAGTSGRHLLGTSRHRLHSLCGCGYFAM